MYSPQKLAWKYVHYWLSASNGKGHGVHSPFVFDFITKVMNDHHEYYCYKRIEKLRQELRSDDTLLTIEDFGAGSRVNSSQQRSVQSIARSALKPRKFGQLLFRIANYYQPNQILELGTSLGITSSYLASASSQSTLTTLEGSAEVATVAERQFKKLGLDNIRQRQGNFDNTLLPALREMPSLDLAFIDGNHRYEPTVRYFQNLLPYCHEHTILIFDDVHWSSEMEAAWEEIKSHNQVLLTIDLFFIGLVFLRKDFKEKQHFTIRF